MRTILLKRMATVLFFGVCGSCLAMTPKEFVAVFDKLPKTKSPDGFIKALGVIGKMSEKEKARCVDYILSKRPDMMLFVSLLMKPDNFFNLGLDILDGKRKVSAAQKDRIQSLLCSVYYRPQITNKQRERFQKLVADKILKREMLISYIVTSDMLRLKSSIPSLLSVLNAKETTFREKLRILSCLKTLEYDRMERLQKNFRKKLLASGDEDKMFTYSVELDDKKMKLDIDILKLKSRSPDERMRAVIRLRKATGKNFGFNPMGSEKERKAAFEKWKSYLEESDL